MRNTQAPQHVMRSRSAITPPAHPWERDAAGAAARSTSVLSLIAPSPSFHRPPLRAVTATPHIEEPAMQLWPATIASPPPRGVGSWHIYAYAKTMPLYSRKEQKHTGGAPRPMARGAHVWARPSSLGTGPVPRSHLERRGAVTLRTREAATCQVRPAIPQDGWWCFDSTW
jgi:hypothetical protein